MRPTVLLFDVDGTLITSGGSGRRAMIRALGDHGVDGPPTFSFAGMTDRLIVRTALEEAAQVASSHRIDEVIDRYLTHLEEAVRETPDGRYRVHEGIPEAIRRGHDAGFAVGLGTGNVKRGATIKLTRVKLADAFAFGGFGSDHEDRRRVIRHGAQRGASSLGAALETCRVVVIGDTPRDIDAAHALRGVAGQVEACAVATGSFGEDELAPHEPDHLFPDLAARGALDALLGR